LVQKLNFRKKKKKITRNLKRHWKITCWNLCFAVINTRTCAVCVRVSSLSRALSLSLSLARTRATKASLHRAHRLRDKAVTDRWLHKYIWTTMSSYRCVKSRTAG
jgi:hypothetical protein